MQTLIATSFLRPVRNTRKLSRILVRTYAMAPNQTIPPLSDKSLFKQECYVNGQWIKAKSGKTFEVKDPGSGKFIGTCPECSKEDTDEAIKVAAAAFPSFRKTTGRERARMLRKWYQLMVDNAEDIAKLITWENGKPFADAKGEAAYAASFFEWFSEEAPRTDGDTISATTPGNRIFTIKEPVGVCGLITPWNFPAAMITRKVGPALAAGCTVVAKSPGETPFTSLALAELAHRAGIPKGVVNFITALDNTAEVGSALTASPTVRKISFTGSTGVGKLLMKQSADTLKKLSFELGGNAPFIVFDDADLDVAINGAIACKFRSSGQTCVCANRIYVQKGIYDKFSAAFAEKVKSFKVGGGYDEGVTHGPLIHDRAVSKVDAQVRDAEKKGGKIVIGGQKMEELGSNFFQPTVITGMTMDMQLASEETFGPVAGLFPFDTEAEVVGMANKVEVGLAGYFYSNNLQRAYRVAEALEVGMVGINTGLVSDPAAPFGGVKDSGFGREGSKYGISEYQITKMVTMGGMGQPLQDHGTAVGYGHRSERARRSGGFLLQDTTPRYTYKTLKPPSNQAARHLKGKARAEDVEIVAERRTPTSHHQQRQSIGSSPLSTVIYNRNDGSEQLNPNGSNADEILLVRNGASDDGRNPRDELHSSVGQAPSALGHDTDPAQIVNLALSLSESRRRNAGGGRLSPLYVNPDRRQVSSEQGAVRLSGSYGSVGGTNLRKHVNEKRRISRNNTPVSSTHSTESPSPKYARSFDGDNVSASSRYLNTNSSDEILKDPSSATMARAERARIAFELSYQYRRLLQYLPRLPTHAQSEPTTSEAASDPKSTAFDYLGRAYNPLQYIRNRKVRGRERKHLDAEAEGWKDLDSVTHWIDAIASEHKATKSLMPNQVVLPPLHVSQSDLQSTQTSSNIDSSGSTNTRSAKSEEQDMDWQFTPWDLLADAAWLTRDDNLSLIEDGKGSKILPQNKQLKEATPRTSLEHSRGLLRRSLSLVRRGVEDERRSLELETPKKKGKSRGHLLGKSYNSTNTGNGYDIPRDRKGRWHRSFGRSRSPSSSEGSMTDGMNGHAWGNHRDRDGLDSAALEKQMMRLLAKEFEEDPVSTSKPVKPAQELPNDDRTDRHREQVSDSPALNEPQDQARSPEHGMPIISLAGPGRPSDLEDRGRQPRSSLDDLDVTAPSSPSTFQFGPSIFINRSAPNSRSVSPKKRLPSRFRPTLRSSSKSRRTVSEYRIDAATQSPTKDRLPHTRDMEPDEIKQTVPKSDSDNNLLSPVTAEIFGKRFRRMNNSSSSLRAGKEGREPESRFKGLLKGTRIAELVGNEVSRVGDKIWRRDAGALSRASSPVNARVTEGWDTDGENSTLENSPETDLSRVTTKTDDGGSISRLHTKHGQPKYHHPNLPVFRSSMSQAAPGSPISTSPEDHPITRQQLAQKARGRSSKFERLAPPKIDMRNVSPSTSPPRSRIQTNNINDISRNNSTSRTDHRVRSADRRLNDVLGIPGTVRNVAGPTGLANLSSNTSHRPGMDDRQWSISDRSVSNTRTGTVTKRDIARVRALLLSSGIKANEIARQADTVDDPPFLPLLRDIHQRWGNEKRNIPRVPRQQEHLLTAKLIVQEIDTTSQRLRDAAENYSDKTIEELHQGLKDLDAYVSNNLVPMVRGSADGADNLSTELTTTHTLAVKRVNDAVELVLRRRRRRLRWLRRGGYAVLEWMLLGIMWAVWMVVVAVSAAAEVPRGKEMNIRALTTLIQDLEKRIQGMREG
ncbi:MAG: hypothetical protein Q9213_003103 [Squamulea squamosa]